MVFSNFFYNKVKEKNEKMDYGILSLSETYNHPLMWSHYADQYKGIVVGFDFSLDFFNEIFSNGNELLFPVKYCNQPPLYSIENEKHLSGIEGFLATKGIQWSYEYEWRMITNNYSNKIRIDNIGGFIEIPSKYIKTIILGLRRTQKMIDKAKEFTETHKHIKLYLSYKALGSYSLEFFEIGEALKIFPKSLLVC